MCTPDAGGAQPSSRRAWRCGTRAPDRDPARLVHGINRPPGGIQRAWRPGSHTAHDERLAAQASPAAHSSRVERTDVSRGGTDLPRNPVRLVTRNGGLLARIEVFQPGARPATISQKIQRVGSMSSRSHPDEGPAPPGWLFAQPGVDEGRERRYVLAKRVVDEADVVAVPYGADLVSQPHEIFAVGGSCGPECAIAQTRSGVASRWRALCHHLSRQKSLECARASGTGVCPAAEHRMGVVRCGS
jgi:hypothetical protein